MSQPRGPAKLQSQTAMQLAMERAGITPPPEKVIELRDAKNIARAVRYVEDELKTHLQLGTADTESKTLLVQAMLKIVTDMHLALANSSLADGVDQFLKIISELDQVSADSLNGANAQIAELVAELESAPAGGTNRDAQVAILAAAITIEQIDAELVRRGEESKRVQPVYDALVGQLVPLENELDLVEKKLASEFYNNESGALAVRKRYLNSEIAKIRQSYDPLTTIITDNNREVDKLRNYRNAMEVVKRGLPSGLIGKKLGFGK